MTEEIEVLDIDRQTAANELLKIRAPYTKRFVLSIWEKYLALRRHSAALEGELRRVKGENAEKDKLLANATKTALDYEAIADEATDELAELRRREGETSDGN